MYQLLSSVKDVFHPQQYTIDNGVFRLHYRFTMAILLMFSILVTASQYFGDPISCISGDDIPKPFLNTYCWIHSTFSVVDSWHKQVGVEVPYPGVDIFTSYKDRVFHGYYQWVCFVLFFQALCFYVPRYIWWKAEGHLMKNMSIELRKPVLNDTSRTVYVELVATYLWKRASQFNWYFFVYACAEVLNLLNVLLQVKLIDWFLGGQFTKYGLKVVSFSEYSWPVRYDPMIEVFPRLTKCTFHKFGSSGDVQKHDALCILPLNIVNEKIYIIIWFWFATLALISLGAILYRMLILFSTHFRTFVMVCHCRVANRGLIESLLSKVAIGDWFVLYLLAKNIDAFNFQQVVLSLNTKLSATTDVKMASEQQPLIVAQFDSSVEESKCWYSSGETPLSTMPSINVTLFQLGTVCVCGVSGDSCGQTGSGRVNRILWNK